MYRSCARVLSHPTEKMHFLQNNYKRNPPSRSEKHDMYICSHLTFICVVRVQPTRACLEPVTRISTVGDIKKLYVGDIRMCAAMELK